MISIKELYRHLSFESPQSLPKRSNVVNRVSYRERNIKSAMKREKSSVRGLPELFIQMWKVNNHEENDPKPRCQTPELLIRPFSSVLIKRSVYKSNGLGVLQGKKMRHKSSSVESHEARPKLKRKRTINAVIPKVEQLLGTIW